MAKILQFLQEAKTELARVNWPTQKEIIHYTIIVVVVSIGTSLFLGSLDYLFSQLVQKFLLAL
jgi:preprotein translocase subunit SecE